MKKLNYDIYLNNTSKCFFERGFEAVLAVTLIMFSLFLLQLFPVVGIALAIFSYGFLCIGTKKYLLSVCKDEYLPIESIFKTYKICIKAFCLKFAISLLSFLWSIVFIVPGIVALLNYSLSSFVMAEDNKKDALKCMLESKKLTYGHRAEIFIIYLAYFFVIVACASIFASVGTLIISLNLMARWAVIALIIFSVIFVLMVFVVPYFELLFANVYLVLKEEKSRPKTNETKRKVKSAAQNE